MSTEKFKSGFVTVIGRTNVGKSSIINALVREKVSAIANKPQTTRKIIRGILNTENSQIIFIDTPGIHKAHSKLGKIMNESAIATIPDVDVIIYVVDVTDKKVDNETIEKLKKQKRPIILVLNKVDLINREQVAEKITLYSELIDFVSIVPLSVVKNDNLDVLVKEIENNLLPGPKYYDVDEYTTQTSRELVEETVREKALRLLKEEVPHGILVECEKMKMRKTVDNKKFFDIDVTVYCVRESHKSIIIGKNGQMLKKIGTFARYDLEEMLGVKVNLNIWVKVKEDWINDLKIVNKFKLKEEN